MKQIELTVTFTGRVDDVYAKALETAWVQSKCSVTVPIRDVAISTFDNPSSQAKFDFCQPVRFTVKETN